MDDRRPIVAAILALLAIYSLDQSGLGWTLAAALLGGASVCISIQLLREIL